MKPILFNTSMVRAILEDRKTVTRRVVKPQPKGNSVLLTTNLLPETVECGAGAVYAFEDGTVTSPPYRPGDILYVRETWAKIGYDVDSIWFEEPGQLYNGQIIYRADWTYDLPECRWHPSIHMPREAARIFLRVTDVRVERLQDISEEQSEAEGCEAYMAEFDENGYWESTILDFIDTWNSTIKPTDRFLYGWNANPWVWVVKFEQISREESEHG